MMGDDLLKKVKWKRKEMKERRGWKKKKKEEEEGILLRLRPK